MSKQANRKSQSLYHRIENINPTKAAKYLETVNGNRKLSPSTVTKYIAAMEKGQWGFSVISFNSDGELNDGQHRLHALIRSGTSHDFLVIRGNDDFAHMDAGKARSPADVLHIIGYKNTNVLAAVARAIIGVESGLARWPGGSGGTMSRITVDDIISRVKQEPRVLQTLADDVSNPAKFKVLSSLVKSGATAGWFIYAVRKGLNKENQPMIEDFLNVVCGHEPGQNGDPALALYRRLSRVDEANRRMSRQERCALLIKAWNAYFAGQETHRLMYRPFGKSAESFPVLELDKRVAVGGSEDA